jgi:hypothetical protein
MPTVKLPAWPALPLRLDRVVGAEAIPWLAFLLVLPILAVGVSLTTGWRFAGLPWIDNDYWWYLGTGEWILDHRRVPRTDPFSWTNRGEGWVAHEWLAEAVLALAVRAGGYAGGVVLTATLAVAGFWWLVGAARTYGLSWRACALLTLLWGGVFLRAGVIVVRPQLWTFALLSLLLVQIAAYDTGRRRSLWLLPPLFVVWVNLNLTALVGIACLGALGLDRLIRRRLDRHLVVIGVLSFVGILVNPNGPALLATALKYRGGLRHEHVFEWMSPDLGDPTHRGFLLALPMVPLAVWQLFRLRPWPALPVLVLCYQSFNAIRFIPIYVMLAFVFAAWLAWQFGQERTDRRTGTLAIDYRRPWTFAAAAIAVAFVLTVAIRSDYSVFRREPVARGYPVGAATLLLERYPDARLFNVYDYGGYLIYRFDGDAYVYVDGREEMYGDVFLRRYFDLIAGVDGWEDAFEQDGINAVLVRQGPVTDGLAIQLQNNPDWELVYADGYSVLYVQLPREETQPAGDQIGG